MFLVGAGILLISDGSPGVVARGASADARVLALGAFVVGLVLTAVGAFRLLRARSTRHLLEDDP